MLWIEQWNHTRPTSKTVLNQLKVWLQLMSTNLTYNEFPVSPQRDPSKEISQLWKEYKSGDYSFPKTEASKASQVEAQTEPTADVAESTEKEKTSQKS